MCDGCLLPAAAPTNQVDKESRFCPGRKYGGIKAGGHAVSPSRGTPPRNAGWGHSCGGQKIAPGVSLGVRSEESPDEQLRALRGRKKPTPDTAAEHQKVRQAKFCHANAQTKARRKKFSKKFLFVGSYSDKVRVLCVTAK